MHIEPSGKKSFGPVCRVLLVLSLWLVASPVRADDTSDVDLRPLVSASIEVYNELADDPLPFLTTDQVEDLIEGKVIKIRRRPRGDDPKQDRAERVTGYILIRQPREGVWLAALDPEFRASDMLTEVRLRQDESGGSVWYQHVALPLMFADRHWVIELHKNTALAAATQDFIWEQLWKLAENGRAIAARAVAEGLAEGLTPAKVAEAIYLPTNEGGWTLFAIDENVTLLAYRVSTVVGGGIPDSWIATFAMAQLEGLLRDIERNSATAWQNYDATRSPIFGGDGALIPTRATSPE